MIGTIDEALKLTFFTCSDYLHGAMSQLAIFQKLSLRSKDRKELDSLGTASCEQGIANSR